MFRSRSVLVASIAIAEPHVLMLRVRTGDGRKLETRGAVLRQVAVRGVARNLGPAIRLVASEHTSAAQPSRLQPRQEAASALLGFREALGAADDLVISVLVHADRHHHRHVLADVHSCDFFWRPFTIENLEITVRWDSFWRPRVTILAA